MGRHGIKLKSLNNTLIFKDLKMSNLVDKEINKSHSQIFNGEDSSAQSKVSPIAIRRPTKSIQVARQLYKLPYSRPLTSAKLPTKVTNKEQKKSVEKNQVKQHRRHASPFMRANRTQLIIPV